MSEENKLSQPFKDNIQTIREVLWFVCIIMPIIIVGACFEHIRDQIYRPIVCKIKDHEINTHESHISHFCYRCRRVMYNAGI